MIIHLRNHPVDITITPNQVTGVKNARAVSCQRMSPDTVEDTICYVLSALFGFRALNLRERREVRLQLQKLKVIQ